jgi:tRNA(Ile)-lysidine synthetase-like protein
MKQEINSFIKRHGLLTKGEKVIAAVSGGPDSVAMLHYLNSLELELIVLHIHHHVRPEADEDAAFVEAEALRLELPFLLKHTDVPVRMQETGRGLQQTARTERYKLFEETMKETGAAKVATAHHGDDQVETMLMRFVRGSIQGMKGIPVRRKLNEGEVIRPLLAVTKAEIEDYCRERHLCYRIDASNQSTSYQRNRLRLSVLPELKKENPRIHETAQWQSEIRTEEEAYLHTQAEKELAGAIHTHTCKEITMTHTSFQRIPSALQRRCVHLLLTYLNPQTLWSRHHIEEVHALLSAFKRPRLSFSANRIYVEKSYDQIRLSTDSVEEEIFHPQTVEVPGEAQVPGGVLLAGEKAFPEADTSLEVFVKSADLPFFVRPRLPGDRIVTNAGTKKLKKIFIDAKIPVKVRAQWPIITDRHGTILWVPFLQSVKPPEDFDYDRQSVYLAFRKSGDSAILTRRN